MNPSGSIFAEGSEGREDLELTPLRECFADHAVAVLHEKPCLARHVKILRIKIFLPFIRVIASKNIAGARIYENSVENFFRAVY